MSQRVGVQFPMRSSDFSIDLICPAALRPRGSTQSLITMSTRNFCGSKVQLVHKANNFTAICHSHILYRGSFTFFLSHLAPSSQYSVLYPPVTLVLLYSNILPCTMFSKCLGQVIRRDFASHMIWKSGLQLVKDDHDWYCFECHAGGDVICCTSCHRVYHVSCLAKEEVLQEDVKNTFVCPVCKVMSS